MFAPIIVPYKLTEPTEIITLKKSLNEVSGLNLVSDSNAVLIDDEVGTLFFYNLLSEKVVKQIKFSKGGDWEDLVVKGDTAYVLKSNGTLFEITPLSNPGNLSITELKTSLSTANDTEGLCYDYKRNLLLIACKGRPWIKKSSERYSGMRAIYSFDPVTRKFNTTPEILIDINKVESMVIGMQKNVIRRIMNLYNISTKQSFQPAGLAIHPLNGDLYLVSAVGNVLLILDSEHKLKKAVKLSNKVFKQPEGITFDQSGNLYISNEGKSGKGNILKFSYKKPLSL
ncbi:MAG: SdiA-regulated domain-containing protein [Bacteroidota bacterium]|nr:SdiA-regulated domain-containing protein [Bacteroidota bacterium]